MPYILHIETSTTVCSVGLSKGNELIGYKETDDGYTHAENLHIFIQDVLKETDTDIHTLQAIAVSKGPGSYTGLRIGVSAAKGLAYALNIPLISIDTLKAMAALASQQLPDYYYVPMIDARRMEVYCEIFDSHLNSKSPVQALILNEDNLTTFHLQHPICFFGNGMPKAKDLLSHVPDSFFIEDIKPSVTGMTTIANQKYLNKEFENVAYFEPFYLKDFVAGGIK